MVKIDFTSASLITMQASIDTASTPLASATFYGYMLAIDTSNWVIYAEFEADTADVRSFLHDTSAGTLAMTPGNRIRGISQLGNTGSFAILMVDEIEIFDASLASVVKVNPLSTALPAVTFSGTGINGIYTNNDLLVISSNTQFYHLFIYNYVTNTIV
jgi:hypothetical protein